VGEACSWIEKQELDNAAALHMNAENMGFPSGSFDLALCGFIGWDDCFDFGRGEFTGPDPRTGEIWRVLRAGGRVGISTWERQADLDWMEETFMRYFPSILSEREFIERRPIGYSRESAAGYVTILKSAGFRDIETFNEKVTFVSADEELWWEQMRNLGWYRFFERVEAEGADRLQRLRAGVFSDLQPHKQADGIHFTKAVAFVFGRK
jgi:SAM-dependent methyltransferase